MSYAMEYPVAARAPASARVAFIRRTYAHLAGAILAFVGLETLLISIPHIEEVVATRRPSNGSKSILKTFSPIRTRPSSTSTVTRFRSSRTRPNPHGTPSKWPAA